jgi:high-affinity iron transporter
MGTGIDQGSRTMTTTTFAARAHRPHGTPRRPTVVAAACIGLLALGLSSCASASGSALTSTGVIDVTNSSCASNWAPTTTGAHTYEVTNSTSGTVDVQLLQTGFEKVYAEIFTLGPHTTRPLSVTLGRGTYSWQCGLSDNSVEASSPEPATGPAVAPTPTYQPTTPAVLDPQVEQYRAIVTSNLDILAKATDLLAADVQAQNWPESKTQWLVAHLDYERIGAAYDTFGNFNDEINGRPDGLIGGVNSPQFTGFLRLEYGLWHNQPAATLVKVADALDNNVHALIRAFPLQVTPDTDIALRAHEILENALEFELTGDTDMGSHTNLATVQANVEGTETVISVLTPLLVVRIPKLLTQIKANLAAYHAYLGTFDQGGVWTPVESLTTSEREHVDGDIDELLQELSAIPGELRVFAVGSD